MRTTPETIREQELANALEQMKAESLWQFTSEPGLQRWPRGEKAWNGHYRNPADFLLEHGEFFTPRKTPEKYPLLAAKACFSNSLVLASYFPELTYVEGIIWSAPAINALTGQPVGLHRPVHHAWCVEPDGGVVEVTYVSTKLAILAVRENHAYLGVRFEDGRRVKRAVWENGHTLLDNPIIRHRMLRRPFDPRQEVRRQATFARQEKRLLDAFFEGGSDLSHRVVTL